MCRGKGGYKYEGVRRWTTEKKLKMWGQVLSVVVAVRHSDSPCNLCYFRHTRHHRALSGKDSLRSCVANPAASKQVPFPYITTAVALACDIAYVTDPAPASELWDNLITTA